MSAELPITNVSFAASYSDCRMSGVGRHTTLGCTCFNVRIMAHCGSSHLPIIVRSSLNQQGKLPETFIAMLHLACSIIAWRATGLLK
jgi:hypothetical protein